tara:strand:- start:7 stop:867 length:861 start_codon:yes stop_codon:yes gene_type:complete
MDIITGEKIQQLCDHYISREFDSQIELKGTTQSQKYLDVENFNFTNFDNQEMVYCNSGFVSATKQKLIDLKLYEKLHQFKNPFKLILHNSDQRFYERQLKYLDIPNCKKIYTQNIDVVHGDVIPLPIGVANSCWKWGDLSIWEKVLQVNLQKDNLVHFNFQKEGGLREENNRVYCYDSMIEKGIEFIPNMDYESYLKKLGTYKYSISPKGNGIDCHRMWECFYLKVIPICERSILTEYFSKIFPIVLLDDWNDLDLDGLDKNYDKINKWDNYYQLDFKVFCKEVMV